MTSHDLEPGIVTDLAEPPDLRRLPAARPAAAGAAPAVAATRKGAARHDEMLFIIQHQTTELWMKLMIHELKAAIAFVRADGSSRASRSSRASKHIQRQLFEQWAVLETLTPTEYARSAPRSGTASGFQSHQYRAIEFLLGNKDATTLNGTGTTPRVHAELQAGCAAPSLYDEFLRYLARRGHAIPADRLERDFTQPYERDRGWSRCSARSTTDPARTRTRTTCARSWSTSRSASSSGASAT